MAHSPAAQALSLTLWLLVVVWVCNVADLLLTQVLLSTSRAVEGNAIMAVLFCESGWVAAVGKLGVVTLGVVTLGVVLLWRLRRRGLARMGAAGLAIALVTVVTYEVLWLL